ncbi:MAG: hypothetical protein NWF00_04630 [Candidatus Bathyarchaeota archaeon]|nr:hypothetical protein [Candidatus Bathyarchaeota archaeon]
MQLPVALLYEPSVQVVGVCGCGCEGVDGGADGMGGMGCCYCLPCGARGIASRLSFR